MTENTWFVMKSVPAETFPPGEFIQEELDTRGWTIADLAQRMGGDYGVNYLTVELIIECQPGDKNLLMGRETAEGLARAFGTSVEYWENLEHSWRQK